MNQQIFNKEVAWDSRERLDGDFVYDQRFTVNKERDLKWSECFIIPKERSFRSKDFSLVWVNSRKRFFNPTHSTYNDACLMFQHFSFFSRRTNKKSFITIYFNIFLSQNISCELIVVTCYYELIKFSGTCLIKARTKRAFLSLYRWGRNFKKKIRL